MTLTWTSRGDNRTCFGVHCAQHGAAAAQNPQLRVLCGMVGGWSVRPGCEHCRGDAQGTFRVDRCADGTRCRPRSSIAWDTHCATLRRRRTLNAALAERMRNQNGTIRTAQREVDRAATGPLSATRPPPSAAFACSGPPSASISAHVRRVVRHEACEAVLVLVQRSSRSIESCDRVEARGCFSAWLHARGLRDE